MFTPIQPYMVKKRIIVKTFLPSHHESFLEYPSSLTQLPQSEHLIQTPKEYVLKVIEMSATYSLR